MAQARYRSKLEVLRDLLAATRHASRKTRIIGLANLNPATFQKYIGFARAQGLVEETDGNYRLTDRAERALGVLQELMAKSNELDSAVQLLERSTYLGPIAGWNDGDALRQISRMAWGEVQVGEKSGRASLNRARGSASATDLTLGRGIPTLLGLPSLSIAGRRRGSVRSNRPPRPGTDKPE